MPNQSLHDIDDHLRHIEAINSEVRSVMRASSSAVSTSSSEAELGGGSPEPIPSTPDPQLPSSFECFPLVSLPDVVVRRLLYYLSYDQARIDSESTLIHHL